MAQRGDVIKLLVALPAGRGGQLLAIDAQRIIQVVKEAGDRVGRDGDAGLLEQFCNPLWGLARPAQTGKGVAGRVVFQQEFNGLD